jgi:leucyl-tRNA synthetase
MAAYDPESYEPRWQKAWDDERVFEPGRLGGERKFYCLEMLPYPSGRLHMGHVRNYSIGDVVARMKQMAGHTVIHPMGWDSFGMPAENAAIKHGRHPAAWTEENIATMRGQLRRLGFGYAWSREIASHRPEYYRWNQWLFTRMFEKDLAYRSLRRVNWCPSCQTVLANEQVEGGACWRCESPVEQRDLDQWFFRITRYAQELLDDLPRLEGWPKRVLTMQENWIGRSEGCSLSFAVEGSDEAIEVFTTRVDTIFGCSFVALAPDHPALERLIEGSAERGAVLGFAAGERRVPAAERLKADREKQGVFTGRHAINPVSGERVPIWVANFVVSGYGTGALEAVPAHDQRDFEFAKKYGLPIRAVVEPADGSIDATAMAEAFTGEGVTRDSGPFSGLPTPEARKRITRLAEEGGFGRGEVQYRLRDWGVSRQRYWGTPIPMIHCKECGIVPVPDHDLPVLLPEDVRFTGEGGSPLAASASFLAVDCPRCGGAARRETDTMDTFVDSAWYFYRYLDPRNGSAPFDREIVDSWFPIDLYIGGITHAILHLMYARFFGMVLRDLGMQTRGEPVARLLTQGMVTLGGLPMSKSRGNIVDPDRMVARYGADVTRLFTLFAAPPEKDLEWSDTGADGVERFTRRFHRIVEHHAPALESVPWILGADGKGLPPAGAGESGPGAEEVRSIRRKTHETISRVTEDVGRRLHLNTAVSALMELNNALYLFAPPPEGSASTGELAAGGAAALREGLEAACLLLAPFAPHLAEECWSILGRTTLVAREAWPVADPAMLEAREVTLVVQVNGKLRGRIELPAGADEATALAAARGDEKVAPWLGGTIARTVFVPDKLLNIVVRAR